MTHQTGSGFLIIDRDMIPVQELFHKAQDLTEYRRLQGTVLIGDHPMGTAGKESAPDTGFGLGQGILGLIAVAVHSRGGQQRMLLQLNAADPAHIFIDNTVLQPAFLVIPDMAQAASAALLVDRAVRFDPRGRGGEDLLNDAIAEIFLHLDDPDAELVPDSAHRDKDSHALMASDSHGFRSQVDNFQGNDVIFAQHGFTPFLLAPAEDLTGAGTQFVY